MSWWFCSIKTTGGPWWWARELNCVWRNFWGMPKTYDSWLEKKPKGGFVHRFDWQVTWDLLTYSSRHIDRLFTHLHTLTSFSSGWIFFPLPIRIAIYKIHSFIPSFLCCLSLSLNPPVFIEETRCEGLNEKNLKYSHPPTFPNNSCLFLFFFRCSFPAW